MSSTDIAKLPASWRLRAISLEGAGVMLSSQMLRECAEELEAALQNRDPKRTSWFAHEQDAAERVPRKAESNE